jgi:integrase
MSVSSYIKDGKTLWKAYVNIRDKNNPAIREQRRVFDFESEKAALAEEKKLVREITEKLVKRASQGHTWEAVIDQWEMASREDPNAYHPNSIADHVSSLRRWTEAWLNKPASVLTKSDARDVFVNMESEGKSQSFRRRVKSAINTVYNWGIESKLIPGVNESPVDGIKIQPHKKEKVPDILNIDEIRTLLRLARELKHPWYPVWAMALLTGMRNGELYALSWNDVDFKNGRITVSRSFQSRGKYIKSTKNGQWRTVPISEDLNSLLLEIKKAAGSREHVLPRFPEWHCGRQAELLRMFCRSIGIRSVKFHALRACFATQLLAHDIAPARIMKICGWADLKTMQHYVRLAGVDEKGATERLRIMPSDASVMEEVDNLFKIESKVALRR